MVRQRLILIDVAGTMIAMTIVMSVGWYVVIKPDTASSQMRELSVEVDGLNEELLRLHAVLDEQAAHQRKLLSRVEELGELPSKTPIDRDLNRISSMATANDVRVLDVAPSSTVRYPNVLELRYSIKTAGSYKDQLKFLSDFEKCSFWADVTHLRMGRHANARPGVDPEQKCDLTVSFYSAVQ